MHNIAVMATIEEHRVFRTILQAVSRPGTVHRLAPTPTRHLESLSLFARALLDPETSVAAASTGSVELVTEIAKGTGCRIASMDVARWIVAYATSADGVCAKVSRGSPDYPDESASVVYLVESLSETGGDIGWSGPGIPVVRRPSIPGLDRNEWRSIRHANSSYPLGVDCFFLDPQGRIVALPRSTRLQGDV
ncbi:MAG: phosphonate C-P lyase system protein PhnH [Fibrobacteria bacterium]|nr:phosphonate C-P lyase system protein PhnH [Fibrobacteria bacterium]